MSEGIWCLKVYDIISGPDRWQGSGYTCPLCHYTHISTSAPLSFIISICVCMCQEEKNTIHTLCRLRPHHRGGRWGLACTGCASGPTGGACACVSAVPHVRVAGLTGGANYVEGYTTYCVYRVILFLTHTHTYGNYEGQEYRGGYIGIMENTCS